MSLKEVLFLHISMRFKNQAKSEDYVLSTNLMNACLYVELQLALYFDLIGKQLHKEIILRSLKKEAGLRMSFHL